MSEWIEIDLPERLTVDEAEDFRQQIILEILKGTHIRLSGQNVKAVDAAGIQLLVSTYKTLRREKRQLILINASDPLSKSLKLTGADKLFNDI